MAEVNPSPAEPSSGDAGDAGGGEALPANAYDQIPYPDLSYVSTHPDRLATMATVLGLQPPAVSTARVLDIGCAAGGNILPMAYALPQATIVGLDYSSRQITAGRQRMEELGLSNVTLLCSDLVDLAGPLGDELGQFDYIVAHGIYSWVPEPVRGALLQGIKRLLRPNGVAYVSYNTYPGWHITGIVRDAMLFHSRRAQSPADRAQRAREMVHFLGQHAVENAYRGIFYAYATHVGDGLKASADAFLLHDELEANNHPVYFEDFVADAGAHGLQYLCEVELRQVLPHSLSEETQAKLQEFAGDTIALEQYMDFVRNRMFRQTLLVHADTPLERKMAPHALFGCWVRSQARPVADSELASEHDGASHEVARPGGGTDADKEAATEAAPGSSGGAYGDGVVQYRSPDGATLTTDHPMTQSALAILAAEWPRALSFTDLAERAKEHAAAQRAPEAPAAGPDVLPDEVILAANLLRAYGSSPYFAPLHCFQPAYTGRIGAQPVASPVARLEARTRSVVTNVWHDRVHLQPAERAVLGQLDGNHGLPQLQAAAAQALDKDATPPTEEEVAQMLRRFAKDALLVG